MDFLIWKKIQERIKNSFFNASISNSHLILSSSRQRDNLVSFIPLKEKEDLAAGDFQETLPSYPYNKTKCLFVLMS